MTTSRIFRVIVLGIAAGAFLIGFFLWSDHQEAGREERRTARAASVATDLSRPPTFREIDTPQGTLLEVRFPVDQLGVGFVETQVCYVWRDAALQTASLACPGQPSIDTGTP